MEIWIVYSLVIVFLVAFPLLVLSFAQQPDVSSQIQRNTTDTAKINAIAYGLVVAFFVLFSLLAFAINKGKS